MLRLRSLSRAVARDLCLLLTMTSVHMKYLNKTIAYGLYLLVFLLPLQTRWIIKAGQLNHGPWEYGTYSLYATDIVLASLLLLFIVCKFLISPPSPKLRRTSNFPCPRQDKQFSSNFQFVNFQTKFKEPIWWFIGGLVLVSAVSSVGAADKLLALYKFGWLILGLGLFWLVASANYDRLKLVYAIGAGAFLSAGLGIWQFLSQATFANKWLGLAWHRGADLGASVIEAVGADGVGERWLRAYGGLDHPNILGGMLAIGTLLLIEQIVVRERVSNFPSFAKAAEDKQFFPPEAGQAIPLSSPGLRRTSNFQIIFNDKIFKYVDWFLLLVFTAGLFFSFSRSAWLALAAGLIGLVILAVGRGNLKLQKPLAETILVMGILSLILFSQYQNLVVSRLAGEGRLENKSNFERLASYQESWRIIKNNWLLGVGPGNYTLALRNKIIPDQDSYYYQPAHNAFLLVWAEIGIGGLIFFVGAVIYLFVRLLRPQPQFLKLGLGSRHDSRTATLITLIVLLSLDHWLVSLHFGGLFFWLVLGLVYGKKSQNT